MQPDLTRSRYRNLGDYYGLFAAIADLTESGWRPTEDAAQRLLDFAERVENARTDATDAASDPQLLRSRTFRSNVAGPRRVRIDALTRLIQGT